MHFPSGTGLSSQTSFHLVALGLNLHDVLNEESLWNCEWFQTSCEFAAQCCVKGLPSHVYSCNFVDPSPRAQPKHSFQFICAWSGNPRAEKAHGDLQI